MRYITANQIYTGIQVLSNATIIVDSDHSIIDILDTNMIEPANIEFFDGIICPGFINAHCHLELSHLYKRIDELTGLDGFIADIEKFRKAEESLVAESIRVADEQMSANGIVAVGDICNTNHSFFTKQQSKILYYNFIEVFAFHPSRADFVFEQGIKLINQLKKHQSITPHAPYSASEKLLGLISDFTLLNNSVLTIHNQETEDENTMFQLKTGKVIERIKRFGIETEFWNAPKENSIVATLKQLPNNLKIQLVHNTFTSEEDLVWANNYNKNLFWCFCVNANKFIENTIPNILLFEKNNCNITIGTDSLASNWSLSILDELKTITNAFPQIGLEKLIQWSTINGAKLLGFDENLGTIEVGKSPGINLISNIENGRITKKSTLKKIV